MTASLATTPKRGRPSRREPIFESALRLFRERGFHAILNSWGLLLGLPAKKTTAVILKA